MTDLLLAAVSYLFLAVHIAWSSFALTVILRNGPVIRRWVFEQKKPWACNVCMPLYSCATVTAMIAYIHHDWRVLLAYLPAYAMTNLALDGAQRAARPDEGPIPLPAEMLEYAAALPETPGSQQDDAKVLD